MKSRPLAVIILAAGKGTRMKSSRAKVLQPLAGKTLLDYVIDTVRGLNPARLVIVVGYQADQVRRAVAGPDIEFVEQEQQLGTGHAVIQTGPLLEKFNGDVMILCGDMPFIRRETLENVLNQHRQSGAACTLLTLKSREPKDFGRVIRNPDGTICSVVENRDATDEEKKVDEFNSGVYCFDKALLFNALALIENNNAQREYYLTDTIEYIGRKRLSMISVSIDNDRELFGINSQKDLKQAETILTERQRSS